MGSGIVFNGKLFEGNLGAGVELGHVWKLTDGNKENVNGKIVFDALRAGDKTAEKS